MDKIKISNFRKIKGTWDLDLAPITFFTGENNSGKSSVLKGLMVVSDFCNSKNHFEINFNGLNKDEHKIKDYSNAINWSNNTKSNLEFDFVRDGYAFNLVFKPKINSYQSKFDNDHFSKGQLVSLKVSRLYDSALLEIVQNSLGYQINLDDAYLNRDLSIEDPVDHDVRQLRQTITEINLELKEVEQEIKEKLSTSNLSYALGITSVAALAGASLVSLLAGPLVLGASTIFASKKGREVLSLKKQAERLLDNKKKAEFRIFSLRKETRNNKSKKDINVLRPQFDLNEISSVGLEIDNILRTQIIKYIEASEKSLGKFDKKKDSEIVFSFAENIVNALRFNIYHLSPNRNRQTRLYFNANSTSDINEILRNYSDDPLLEDSKEKRFLLYWLEHFDIGANYRITNIAGQANTVEIFEDKRWVDLVDKGFGAGQLFAILLQIAMASFSRVDKENPLILIEEPESNLHPALQSELTNLFLDAYKQLGVKFIIETHSEYILRKSQLLVKRLNENLENMLFAVFYFDKEKGPYKMNYRDDGVFIERFGKGFFDVASADAIKLLKKSR